MVISEKIYELRKKSNLSQEQLANELGVSRQAISKWESGQSVPDTDKLVAISEYFNVTLDYLVKDKMETITEVKTSVDEGNKGKKPFEIREILPGLIISGIGIIAFVIWVVLQSAKKETVDQIGASSMIVLDGNGILLCICILILIVGIVSIIRSLLVKK